MDNFGRLIIYGNADDKEFFEEIHKEYPENSNIADKKGFGAEQWTELSIVLIGAIANVIFPILVKWLGHCLKKQSKDTRVSIVFKNGREETVIRLRDYKDLSIDKVEMIAGKQSLLIEKLCIKNEEKDNAKT